VYQQKIQTSRPGLIVLVLDDSISMSDPLVGGTDPKYLWVERYAGLILKELLARSNEVVADRAVIKPRYFVHTIVYGGGPTTWPNGSSAALDIENVIKAYAGGPAGSSSLGLTGGRGGTDSRAALQLACNYLQDAVQDDRFKDAFPPMVFHLTDGESQTDAEPVADQIKQLSTNDGNVLLVNALIGTNTNLNYAGPDDFPGYQDEDDSGPLDHSKKLFRMSSEAPETIRLNLVEDGIFPELRAGSRLYFDVRTREMLKHVLQLVGSQGSR
jgi:hypothetical protein